MDDDRIGQNDSIGQGEGYIIRPPSKDLAEPDEDAPPAADEEEMLRRAEAALESLKDEYPQWVEQHIVALETECGKLRQGDGEGATALAAMADVAHDVKGEGTTYGYPLMTALGGSLYRFVADLTACNAVQLDIMEKHVSAMRAVIRGRIEGDGGALGREIIGSLERAVAKYGG